jgi:hypothetical protein
MEYLTAAERAKYIRAELKANFPQVKFSVRSDNYSMGSDVIVKWDMGPTEATIENIIDCLVEDLKELHDINIDNQNNGISYIRKIPQAVWDAVRKEVKADLKARDHPYQNEPYRIDVMVSHQINETNF